MTADRPSPSFAVVHHLKDEFAAASGLAAGERFAEFFAAAIRNPVLHLKIPVHRDSRFWAETIGPLFRMKRLNTERSPVDQKQTAIAMKRNR